jgi:hypothetical protein
MILTSNQGEITGFLGESVHLKMQGQPVSGRDTFHFRIMVDLLLVRSLPGLYSSEEVKK